MSDNWLQYIPKKPQFRPSAQAAAEAESLLSLFMPEAETVEAKFMSGVSFFHPGGNWSGVHCPACGADAEAWWNEAMEAAAKSQFKNLRCVAVCCNATVSLNGLKYLWPAAFGSFVLEAMNPNLRNLCTTRPF